MHYPAVHITIYSEKAAVNITQKFSHSPAEPNPHPCITLSRSIKIPSELALMSKGIIRQILDNLLIDMHNSDNDTGLSEAAYFGEAFCRPTEILTRILQAGRGRQYLETFKA